MRRTIILASCLAALCLAVLAIWLYGRRSGQDGVPVPAVNTGSQASSKSSGSTEKRATDPRLFALPDRFVMFAKDQFSPCYFDREKKLLYRWKDVVLRFDQLPELGPYHSYPIFVAYDRPELSAEIIVKDYAVVPVEPPVKYRVTDKYCRVGFWFRTERTFFMWRGMALSKHELLDKSQDGRPAIIDRDTLGQMIEIDMPDYLKYRPELWKKTG